MQSKISWPALLSAILGTFFVSALEAASQPLPQAGSLLVTITSPGSGSTVSGKVTVRARITATGDLQVGGVQFRLDGAKLGSEDKSEPYENLWNTSSTRDGSHTLTAIARDRAGKVFFTSDPVSVMVANAPPADVTPPTVAITSPGDRATVSGTTQVMAAASDNVRVASVQFFIDETPLGAEETSSPYAISWNTPAAGNGSHALTAVARDAAGNRTGSAPVTVTVSNAPPSNTTRYEETAATFSPEGVWSEIVESSDPAGTASLRFDGTEVSWIAFKAPWAGIAEVYLDGTLRATVDTYSPIEQAQALVYTAAGLTAGPHTLKIKVTATWNSSGCCSWIVVDAFDVK